MAKTAIDGRLTGGTMDNDKTKKPKACGRTDCGVSISIDEVTLTFGRGNLDEHGFWEIPCDLCATDYRRRCVIGENHEQSR